MLGELKYEEGLLYYMYNLYSRRKKDAQGNVEVFVYDNFPATFRNQFFTIVTEVLDKAKNYGFYNAIENLCKAFAREKGLKFIGKYRSHINDSVALEEYIDECSDEDFLDLVDYIFGAFISNQEVQSQCWIFGQSDNFFQNAIDELNLRLKQHYLGYEFLNGEIIVKTNTFTHERIVKPALQLLLDEEFRGAEEEYLLAFENYRQGENKNAILNAAKAFESTMKAICSGMNYIFDDKTDTAKRLINILEENEFYPSYLNNHIAGIRTTLESGAPTLRNKTSGHGQGASVQDAHDEYVEYVLNLVASNIVFLHKLYKRKKAEVAKV